MIPGLMEAALRAFFVLTVVVGLRALRIGGVLAQRTSLGTAAIGKSAMRLPMPITGRFVPPKSRDVFPAHPMTLLEELQARILAKSGSGASQSRPIAASIASADPRRTEKASNPAPDKTASAGYREAPLATQ